MSNDSQQDNSNQGSNQWTNFHNDQTHMEWSSPSNKSFGNNLPSSFTPGQFQYQTVPAPQPPQKRNVLQWYKRQKRSAKIGIGCGTILIALMMCMCSFVGYAGTHPVPLAKVSTATTVPATQVALVATVQPTHQTTKPTPIPTLKPTNTSVPTEVPTSVPTTVPTPIPTTAPTQAPIATVVPTPVPTQPPATGLNGNPWGYNLTAPGNLIYNPPANICNYFNCIASFWNNTNGYVDECVDGTYSHSGGVRGACSRHGGEAQPLYSH